MDVGSRRKLEEDIEDIFESYILSLWSVKFFKKYYVEENTKRVQVVKYS